MESSASVTPRSDSDEDFFSEEQEEQITSLARQLTRTKSYQSEIVGDSESIFNSDPRFDPFSTSFSIKAYTKYLVALASRDPEKYPTRTAGVAFRNLNVNGYESSSAYQQTVGTIPLVIASGIKSLITKSGQRKVEILKGFDGLVDAGEMLVVLGPPGSGCSTLLKTIAGETHGIFVSKDSEINYQGISTKQMKKNFWGEAIYTAEQDIHFPNMTVGETLSFAAYARSGRNVPAGLNRLEFATHRRDVVMAVLGISHTINTRVGNDFIRGVSGGERKRVSIAEAMLAGAPLQCWDNSTRGLDSANSIEFCKTLRTSTTYTGATAAVAIYQSPQSAYDCFDKVTVLYEGYQIYFGKATEAKAYFEEMGFECPEQQSTPDFLTSLTSPLERIPRKGMEDSVPRTAAEFNARWKASDTYKKLIQDIAAYNERYPFNGEQLKKFVTSRRAQQSKHTREYSAYTLSYPEQIKLCLQRGFIRLRADPTILFTQLFGNFVMSLVIASVFYKLPQTTSSFFNRGGVLFFAVLMNAFGSMLEMLILYAQRPIIEKHERYAFYHPSAEAFASMLCDMPYKIVNTFTSNLALYFMTNLRREPGAFFFYILIAFSTTLAMSGVFRSIASLSRSLAQALTPASGLILMFIIYTGFVIPPTYMLKWISWFRWLNPVYYSFEALLINEFNGRRYECSTYVPAGAGYDDVPDASRACSAVGSVVGQSWVDGATYIQLAFDYQPSHRWRNFGIVIVFVIGITTIYLVATETIKAKKSKGEVIVYPRGKNPLLNGSKKRKRCDVESGSDGVALSDMGSGKGVNINERANIQGSTAVFSWRNLCYDVQIKSETRRILDHVDGWVKPGTLTALMGVSGAGKTTLLDVLATRVTMGVVTGEMLIDGRPRDSSFQRKTGYCQQQDLHLAAMTVRESLEFSALLRQPAKYSKAEKLDYVDEILRMLEMESYQDAVIGQLGEGLNVEQRKRLTIGVELVARPELLFFVDEPTSGLDSQTSWSILSLLEKLSKSGQAVLCTIHQPSAMLFSRFDRLLFLAKGGKTVYFEEIGHNSEKLIAYFERNGGPKYPVGANPAEWMLEVIGAAPGSHTDIDWHQTWLDSPERTLVQFELDRLKRDGEQNPQEHSGDASDYKEFAAPLWEQFVQVLKRCLLQTWRNPVYVMSKLGLVSVVGLLIGFSLFRANNSIQGLQNQLFAIFQLVTIFTQLVQQILPEFKIQRDLYEVRERPAKTYSWKIFILANMIAELPWNTVAALLLYFTWYYPVGLYRNAQYTNTVHLRSFQMVMMIWAYVMLISTFAHFIMASMPEVEAAGNASQLMFMFCFIFCGVLVVKAKLGWWIWMYYMSPLTYVVEGLLVTGVARAPVRCSDVEFTQFQPTSGQTCGEYMASFIQRSGGYLQDPNATTVCNFCPVSTSDVFLRGFNMEYSHGWRNFGIILIYATFNIGAACAIYYLVRVPKNAKIEERASDDVKSIADAHEEKK